MIPTYGNSDSADAAGSESFVSEPGAVICFGDFLFRIQACAPANYLHFAAWQLDFSSHARYRSQATHEYA